MRAPLMFHGRLPGVVCDTALPALQEDPLRIDVAAFVGFAERGPLDLPIAVNDINQYQGVFGNDFLLARTRCGGQAVYAALPQAVHSFFNNGGRRCYVVRVGGEHAYANRFRLPGMVAWNGHDLTTVINPAAWVGRWSDNMSIGTQLQSLPLCLAAQPLQWTADGLEIALELTAQTTVRSGDLLRLHFDGVDKPVLFCSVAHAEQVNNALPTLHAIPVNVAINQRDVLAFTSDIGEPLPPPISVECLEESGWKTLLSLPTALLEIQVGANREGILSLQTSKQMQVGDLLRITCMNNQVLLFPVLDVSLKNEQSAASPPGAPEWQITAREMFWQSSFASSKEEYGSLSQVDLLSFDLFIREGQEIQETWIGLRFGSWLDTLVPAPDDLQSKFSQSATTQQSVPGLDPKRSSRLGVPLPWKDDSGNDVKPLYLPLGMGTLPGPGAFVEALPDPDPLADPSYHFPGKDGLEKFDPMQIFLDQKLIGVGVRDLLNEANAILNQDTGGQVTYLCKLHSLLMIDEIGMIALPDLIQRPWKHLGASEEGQPSALEAQAPADDSQFHTCSLPAPSCGVSAQAPGPCDGTFVFYSPPAEEDPPDISSRLSILPVLAGPDDYQMDALLAVQQALVTLCAARADALAVLSLPRHFEKREVLEWQRRFTLQNSLDSMILSYAAVYHPWLQIREQTTPQLSPLRAVPPEGALCGMIAARELSRGPWIAPANVPLRGIVGLTPTFNTADWADLFNAQVNLVRQLPGQFTLLSAHTLSLDDTFVQIAVRRLLIFLRKLALRRGAHYAFEANNERFRQSVQASFERMLGLMVARGALTAFEVDTSSSINTQNDYDQGRFLIALKIAPTQPIEFITIVLLRAGEGLLEVIGG